MDNLGYIDFIFLALIGFFAIKGFFSGFIRELFGVIGLVAGVAIASRYASMMGNWFKSNILDLDSPSLEALIGFIAVFLGIWIIVILISYLLDRFFKTALPKYANGLLGVLFGGVKTFLALAILLYFVLQSEFMEPLKTHIGRHSVMYPAMEGIASKIAKLDIVNHIPKDLSEAKQKIDEVKDEVKEKAKELGGEIQKAADESKKEQEVQTSNQGQ